MCLYWAMKYRQSSKKKSCSLSLYTCFVHSTPDVVLLRQNAYQNSKLMNLCFARHRHCVYKLYHRTAMYINTYIVWHKFFILKNKLIVADLNRFVVEVSERVFVYVCKSQCNCCWKEKCKKFMTLNFSHLLPGETATK